MLEMMARAVPKRPPGAETNTMEHQLDGGTEQADEATEQDGRELKRLWICGLEVNEDSEEEDARPKLDAWATDDLSGEIIDDSEVRAACKDGSRVHEGDRTLRRRGQQWKATSEHEMDRLQDGRGVRSRQVARDVKAKRDTVRADTLASTPIAGRDQGGAGFG